MTAHWIPGRLFWPCIEILGPMHYNLRKKFCECHTLQIILSQILGLLDKYFLYYRTLSNYTPGFGAAFLVLH